MKGYLQDPATHPSDPAQQSAFEVQPGLPEAMQQTSPSQTVLESQQSLVRVQAFRVATQHLSSSQLSPSQHSLAPEHHEPSSAQHKPSLQVPAVSPPTKEQEMCSEQAWPASAVRQVPTVSPSFRSQYMPSQQSPLALQPYDCSQQRPSALQYSPQPAQSLLGHGALMPQTSSATQRVPAQ